MSKFRFDGEKKLVLINENVFEFNVLEMYAEWKQWVVNDISNARYPQAMYSIGGEPLGGGKYVAPYIVVVNGWKVKPWSGNYILRVNGYVTTDTGESPFISPDSGVVLIERVVTADAIAYEVAGGGSTNITPEMIWNYENRTLTGKVRIDDRDMQVLAKEQTLNDLLNLVVEHRNEIEEKIKRILGLTQENFRIDEQIYDSANRLLNARIRIFENADDMNDFDKAIAVYKVSARYDANGRCIEYKVERER